MDATGVFVLDGSVTMVWGFENEAGITLKRFWIGCLSYLRTSPLSGRWDVANALLVGERRHRIMPADTAWFLTILGAFPINVDDETVAHAWADTMHLARAHNLSSYDASYLELAIRLGLPLASLDAKLKTAAEAVGVPLFEVA